MARKKLFNFPNALSLNGSTQQVTFPVSSVLNCSGLTSLSIFMRLKLTAVLASGSQYFLFVPGTSGGTAARISFDFQGTKLRLGARDTDGGSFKSITSDQGVAMKGQYITVGGTLDTVGDVIKIYANGILIKSDTSQTWSTISTGNPAAIRLGSAAADNNFSPIDICEFRFYANTVLSAADMQNLHANQPITTSPTVFHKFQSLSGTTLTDEMGAADGTIVGSPTLTTGLIQTRTLIS